MTETKPKIGFNDEELKEVEKIIYRYPEKRSAIMPLLWIAQKKWGWLSVPVQRYIAGFLEIPLATVQGVVSFYTMFFDKQMGKHHIQVCTNVSCMLREGEAIFQYISNKLGIKNLEVTPDGKFSLEEVECMGACGGAPMIAINEDYYENVTIEQIDKIFNSLK